MKAVTAIDKGRIGREPVCRQACERDGGGFLDERGVAGQAGGLHRIPPHIVKRLRLERVDDDVRDVPRTGGAEGFADGDLGAGGSEDFEERAIEEALKLHGGFVGFDFGEHHAGFDGFAFFFEPFDQRAHRHGVAEFGHFDDIGHGSGARSARLRDESYWLMV